MIKMKHLSIKNKLILMQLITTVFVLLIYSIFLFFNNMQIYRKSIINQLTSMAQLIGTNSVSALNFLDNATAEEILLSLTKEENIVNAWIYDADGNLFAKYSKDGYANFIFPHIIRESHEFGSKFVTLSKKILQDNEFIGMVSLRLYMRQFQHNLKQNLIIAFLVLVVGIIIALLLSMLSQRYISNPILRLAETVRKVSITRNYSIRIEKESKDEIGILYDGFNNMLEQTYEHELERDKAEAALRESEKKFRKVFESSNDAMMLLNENKIFDCNSAALKVFGYTTREEFCGQHPSGFSPSNQPTGMDSRQASNEHITKAYQNGRNFFEWTHCRMNGEDFSAEVLLTPVEIEGKMIIQATVRDITERKKVEKEINFLAHSVKSISECVSITDLENKILFVNKSFLKTYGYEEHELIGKNINLIRSNKNPPELLHQIQPATLTKGWHGELLNIRKDGSEFPISLSTSFTRDEYGKTIALIGIATDISERKKTEMELTKHREHLEELVKKRTQELVKINKELEIEQANIDKLFETAQEAIVMADKDGRVLRVNKEFTRLFNYSFDEVLGSYIDDLVASEGYHDEAVLITKKVVNGEKVVLETVRRNRDGISIQVSLLASPIIVDGKLEAIYAIYQDITDRKWAEAALEERAKKLVEMNIRLKEADRLKSQFLANMSHELRTPLNSIIGFTGILLMQMSGEINEEQKKQLNLIKNSSKHLLSLINDILDISKIEAGKVELFIEEFLLNDIIEEVVEIYSPVLNEKGLKLLKDIPAGITLHSDKRRFKQVLMNLVTNAVKFTEQGSIKVEAIVFKDKNLEICVTDTGIGVKEEDMDKLFKSFQQVDMSSTKRYEGTGLGLHLSRKLVIIMGGDISAKSEYGKGSKFTISLPLKYKEKTKNEKSINS